MGNVNGLQFNATSATQPVEGNDPSPRRRGSSVPRDKINRQTDEWSGSLMHTIQLIIDFYHGVLVSESCQVVLPHKNFHRRIHESHRPP